MYPVVTSSALKPILSRQRGTSGRFLQIEDVNNGNDLVFSIFITILAHNKTMGFFGFGGSSETEGKHESMPEMDISGSDGSQYSSRNFMNETMPSENYADSDLQQVIAIEQQRAAFHAQVTMISLPSFYQFWSKRLRFLLF